MKPEELKKAEKSFKKLNESLIEFEDKINKMISSITGKYDYNIIDIVDYREFSITKNKIKELREDIKKYKVEELQF